MLKYGIRMANQLKSFKILRFNSFAFSQSILPIKLGDLGEGTKEATVKKWYKNVGDPVEEVIVSLI